jgi:hypothetical protein
VSRARYGAGGAANNSKVGACLLQFRLIYVIQTHLDFLKRDGKTSPGKESYFVKIKKLGLSCNLADGHSYLPTGIVATHIFAVSYFSVIVLRTIYRSYIALPPSSATRFREPLRQGYVQAFSLLALVSLAAAAYFGVTFSSLSYRVWAIQRGVEFPDRFFIPPMRLLKQELTPRRAFSGIMEHSAAENTPVDSKLSGGSTTLLFIEMHWR